MVYEVKCSNCGDILNFGGRDPEESHSGESKIPENAMEFDDEVYCRDCVKEFVKFGSKDLIERVEKLERKVENELG